VSIHFTCPSCRARLTAPDGRAGFKRPCSRCGQRLRERLNDPESLIQQQTLETLRVIGRE
jgi:hypothetical protein